MVFLMNPNSQSTIATERPNPTDTELQTSLSVTDKVYPLQSTLSTV